MLAHDIKQGNESMADKLNAHLNQFVLLFVQYEAVFVILLWFLIRISNVPRIPIDTLTTGNTVRTYETKIAALSSIGARSSRSTNADSQWKTELLASVCDTDCDGGTRFSDSSFEMCAFGLGNGPFVRVSISVLFFVVVRHRFIIFLLNCGRLIILLFAVGRHSGLLRLCRAALLFFKVQDGDILCLLFGFKVCVS